MKKRFAANSLRFKLVLASVLVEALMLTLLVANSLRLMEISLTEQEQTHLQQLAPLLNASLSGPLVQRDYATIQEILRESRHRNGIVYFVLLDAGNKIVAADGWDISQPLPPLDANIDDDDEDSIGRFDTETPIQLAGQTYGHLRYGVSTEIFTRARAHLLKQSMSIAIAEICLSVILLALLGYWLTRHLLMLTRGAEEIAAGNFEITLPVRSGDEVGQLTTAFNTMASNIRDDIEALRRGNEAQLHYLIESQREQARLNSLLSAMSIGVLFVSPDERWSITIPPFCVSG